MRIYIIAGEASGDLHAANFVKELKQLNPQVELRGWGGDLMQNAGVTIVKHYRELAFMGFIEVIRNLRTILKNIKICIQDIEEFKPDAVFLVDYPGFNLRMATWANNHNIPVYYYIAPQVWAWNEKRVKILREAVRKLFIILPFEKAFFAKHGINAYYFGHPLLQLINEFTFDFDFRSKNNLTNQSIIAVLPGSRKQEIKTMLPIYLESVRSECKYQIVIAGLTQHRELYERIFKQHNANPKIV